MKTSRWNLMVRSVVATMVAIIVTWPLHPKMMPAVDTALAVDRGWWWYAMIGLVIVPVTFWLVGEIPKARLKDIRLDGLVMVFASGTVFGLLESWLCGWYVITTSRVFSIVDMLSMSLGAYVWTLGWIMMALGLAVTCLASAVGLVNMCVVALATAHNTHRRTPMSAPTPAHGH